MFNDLLNLFKEMPVAKKFFIAFIIIGYTIGLLGGFTYLKTQHVKKVYCVESVGPVSCQLDEDCDRECLKYQTRVETREKEAFYTYGLLGAFIGGWMGVIVVTYVLKK